MSIPDLNGLFHLLPNDVNSLYLALRKGFDPSGRICVIRVAAFISLHDHTDATPRILFRSVNSIPPPANLCLRLGLDQVRPPLILCRVEEYDHPNAPPLHIHTFDETALAKASTNRRHLYDRKVALPPGSLKPGKCFRFIVRWGVRGQEERQEIDLWLRL